MQRKIWAVVAVVGGGLIGAGAAHATGDNSGYCFDSPSDLSLVTTPVAVGAEVGPDYVTVCYATSPAGTNPPSQLTGGFVKIITSYPWHVVRCFPDSNADVKVPCEVYLTTDTSSGNVGTNVRVSQFHLGDTGVDAGLVPTPPPPPGVAAVEANVPCVYADGSSVAPCGGSLARVAVNHGDLGVHTVGGVPTGVDTKNNSANGPLVSVSVLGGAPVPVEPLGSCIGVC